MKFIINTSFVPYFCAIFDDENKLIASQQWEDGRQSGEIVWEFIKLQDLKNKSVNFLGAVSGPGGFSHLRTSGVIINALSFYFKQPIHQARADVIIHDFLFTGGQKSPVFALNSFGEGLFFVQEQTLIRVGTQAELIEKKYNKIPTWVKLLPAEKQGYFEHQITEKAEDIESSTLKTLLEQKPSKTFVPDYEYPAVQA